MYVCMYVYWACMPLMEVERLAKRKKQRKERMHAKTNGRKGIRKYRHTWWPLSWDDLIKTKPPPGNSNENKILIAESGRFVKKREEDATNAN